MSNPIARNDTYPSRDCAWSAEVRQDSGWYWVPEALCAFWSSWIIRHAFGGSLLPAAYEAEPVKSTVEKITVKRQNTIDFISSSLLLTLNPNRSDSAPPWETPTSTQHPCIKYNHHKFNSLLAVHQMFILQAVMGFKKSESYLLLFQKQRKIKWLIKKCHIRTTNNTCVIFRMSAF